MTERKGRSQGRIMKTAILHMLDGSIRAHKIEGGWLPPDEMVLDGMRFVQIRGSKSEYKETKEKRRAR